MKRCAWVFIFFTTLSLLLAAPLTFTRAAENPEPTTLNSVEPKLQIPIAPNFQFSKILTGEETDAGGTTTYAYIPYLAEYFSMIYKYLIGAAGILAGIMITIGGVQWLLAAGEAPKIAAAKKRITDALIGLVLVLGSYTVLYSINPDLVTFKNLKVKLVDYEETDDLESETTPDEIGDAGIADAMCGPGFVNARWPENQRSPIVAVSSQNGLTTNLLTTQHNQPALMNAINVLKNQFGISVRGSGARSMKSQIDMVMKRCQWSDIRRNYVNCTVATASTPKMWLAKGQPNPEYAGCTHINSLDLFATGPDCGAPCAKITTEEGRLCWATNPCQQKLIGAMIGSGFGVLMNTSACSKGFEPWHFNRRPESGFQRSATSDMELLKTKFQEALLKKQFGC